VHWLDFNKGILLSKFISQVDYFSELQCVIAWSEESVHVGLLCLKKSEIITVMVVLLLLLLMMMTVSWLLFLLLCYFPKVAIIYSKTRTRFFMKYN
jgi:hypothetical protein